MDLLSPSPLRATTLLCQPRAGTWVLAVIVKATYTLAPGISPLADEQEPPNDGDSHWDDDPARSLSAASDLTPFKPWADVVLIGNAFAPRQIPARSVVARLAVGQVDKSIEVFCERRWTAVGAVREGAKFVKMPLHYERAAGGPDTGNPVGVRPSDPSNKGRLTSLPNLQPAGVVVTTRGDVIAPIGFGPIAPTWPGRIEKLGNHVAGWSHSNWHRLPLPEDIDVAYFNVAPPDQQMEELHEDESILLENLHPEYPVLETRLPGVRPQVIVERWGQDEHELTMRCDTLWIDTDRGICTLTWRGRINLEGPEETGRAIVTMVQGEQRPVGPSRASASPRVTTSAVRDQEAGVKSSFITCPEIEPRESSVPALPPPQDEVSGTVFLIPGAGHASSGGTEDREPRDIAPPPMVPPVEIGPVTAVLDAPAALGVARALAPVPFPPLSPPRAPVPPAPPSAPRMPSSAAGQTFNTQGFGDEHGVVAPPFMRAPSFVEPSEIAPPAFVSTVPQPAMSPARPPPLFSNNVPLGPNARMGSLAEISSGAAGLGGAMEMPAPASLPQQQPRPSPKQATRRVVPEPIELLSFDLADAPRIREQADWKILLAQLELRDLDRKIERSVAGMAAEPEEPEPNEKTDRRNIREILSLGEPVAPVRVKDALEGAVDEDGHLEPPLVLVAGKLKFVFDEIESLKAALAAVKPLLVAGDEKLKEAAATGSDILQLPWPELARAQAGRATQTLRAAFEKTRVHLDKTYVDELIERAMLQGRHYQRRTVFGQVCLRAFLETGSAKQDQLLVYLPDSLANELPMFPELKVRIIAEVRAQQDKYEDYPVALRALAVARVG